MKEQKLPHGMSIVGFESAEEMYAYMAEQEAEAQAGARDPQIAITWGDYVIRMVPGLAIFGHIFTSRQFLAENSKPGQGPDEEILDELEDLKEAHARGYRYGKWFSTVEPDGEYGSAHVVNLWKITADDFVAARKNGWLLDRELGDRVMHEIEASMEGDGDE